MPMGLGAIFDRGVNQAAQRRFQVDPTLTLSMSPELAMVLPIDAPEVQYHLGWRRFCAAGTISALAANNALLQLRNPVGSGLLCVVEWVSFYATVALELTTAQISPPATVDLTSVFGAVPRDNLQTVAVTSTCVVSAQPGGVLPINGVAFGYPASSPANFPGLPFIVRPGNAYRWCVLQANQAVDFTIVYRERMANDQENQP